MIFLSIDELNSEYRILITYTFGIAYYLLQHYYLTTNNLSKNCSKITVLSWFQVTLINLSQPRRKTFPSFSLFLPRAIETWIRIETAKCVDRVGRKSPAAGFTALLSFQISQHASMRGSTRTMVHECVRRARTMVQLRMYRRLLLPEYNPSRHHSRNSSLSLSFSLYHARAHDGNFTAISSSRKTSAVFLAARDTVGNLELPRRFTLRAPAILSQNRGTTRRLCPFFGGLGNG